MAVTQPVSGPSTANCRASRFPVIAGPWLESVVERKRRRSRSQARASHQPHHAMAPPGKSSLLS